MVGTGPWALSVVTRCTSCSLVACATRASPSPSLARATRRASCSSSVLVVKSTFCSSCRPRMLHVFVWRAALRRCWGSRALFLGRSSRPLTASFLCIFIRVCYLALAAWFAQCSDRRHVIADNLGHFSQLTGGKKNVEEMVGDKVTRVNTDVYNLEKLLAGTFGCVSSSSALAGCGLFPMIMWCVQRTRR